MTAVTLVVTGLVIGSPAGSGSTPPVSILFEASYTVDAHATQPAFDPGSSKCVPAVVQKEIEQVTWTMRFVAPSLPTRGSATLAANSVVFSGTHLWDEASAKCAAFPAGHLVCRGHFATNPESLVVSVAPGGITFHPEVVFNAVSTGPACLGQVYNEHPDCGARDAAAVTDFAFVGTLSSSAPQLKGSASTASFDVQRSRSCAHAGLRNPGVIDQRVSTRYRGTFMLRRR